MKTPIDLSRYTRSRLGMRSPRIDIFQWQSELKRRQKEGKPNFDLLEKFRLCWESLSDFRERSMRAFRYYSGDQWSDEIVTENGTMTEEYYISSQGKVPLKQNIMRQIGKNLLGQYLTNPTVPIINARAREEQSASEMVSNALQCAYETNMGPLLDARMFEQFMLCGLPIQKIRYRYWEERGLEDVWLENINAHKIAFTNRIYDPRMHELDMIGEIIDTTIDNIVSTFAKNEDDEKYLRDTYAIRRDEYPGWTRNQGLTEWDVRDIDFFVPLDANIARLYEIWYKSGEWRYKVHDPVDGTVRVYQDRKEIDVINEERRILGKEQGIPFEEIPFLGVYNPQTEKFIYDEYYYQPWKVKYLTPYGDCLYEAYAENIYDHREHPYVLLPYPLLNGRVWGVMEDVIDQQRYINRLIILLDFIVSASAKGVLLIFEDQLPDGVTPEQFGKEWVKFNGVIVIKRGNTPGDLPKQLTSNAVPGGLMEMMTIQMKLVQEISGVNNALQGIQPQSGTPAARYAMEATNSSLNNLDLMTSFSKFKQMRDMKMLKVLIQYYNEPRYLTIAGNSFSEEAKWYNPEKIKDLEFDVSITKSQDTPVDRMRKDEMLIELLKGQFIDIEMFLQNSSMPYAEKMLDSIRKQKEQLMQGQIPQAPPELVQSIQQEANPQALAMLNQMLQLKPMNNAGNQ